MQNEENPSAVEGVRERRMSSRQIRTYSSDLTLSTESYKEDGKR